jgi:hypothetical protein
VADGLNLLQPWNDRLLLVGRNYNRFIFKNSVAVITLKTPR